MEPDAQRMEITSPVGGLPSHSSLEVLEVTRRVGTDTYAVPQLQPCRAVRGGARMPASCVPHAPEAQGTI